MAETFPSSLASKQVRGFLDELASAAPTPGGGASAALVGAMGAALVSMVCNLTIGRPRYAEVEERIQQLLELSERARRRFLTLAEEDEQAFAAVGAAYRLPRATEQEKAARTAGIQAALAEAIKPPLATLAESRTLLPLCLEAAAHGNPAVVSDAGVAAELAMAAARSAILNVKINLAELRDAAIVGPSEAAVAAAEQSLPDELDRVRVIVNAKLAPKARA